MKYIPGTLVVDFSKQSKVHSRNAESVECLSRNVLSDILSLVPFFAKDFRRRVFKLVDSLRNQTGRRLLYLFNLFGIELGWIGEHWTISLHRFAGVRVEQTLVPSQSQ